MTNRQLDEAFNKHDAAAVVALFTTNATLVSPLGIFSGRDGVEKYFTEHFQRFDPSDQLTKISYVYAFGDDLCGIGGWSVIVKGRVHGGGLSDTCVYPCGRRLEDSCRSG